MSFIIFLAVLSMLSAMLIAESAENDGSRINIAGSLRMQSYKIANHFLIEQVLIKQELSIQIPDQQGVLQSSSSLPDNVESTQLATAIEVFDQKINQAILKNYILKSDDLELKEGYIAIVKSWHRLKSNLLNPQNKRQIEDIFKDIDTQVINIDQLVKQLEIQTHDKLTLIRLVQSSTLFLTLLIGFIALYEFTNHVVFPLRKLVEVAQKIGKKDFTSRVDHKSDDELGLLAHTFNIMSFELAESYNFLQEQVSQKTQKLKDANEALEILYQSSRELTNNPGDTEQLKHFLKRLSEKLKLDLIIIRLTDPNHKEIIKICREKEADEKADFITRDPTQAQETLNNAQLLVYPIVISNKQFGQIELHQQTPPEEWQSQVISSMADNIAMAFGLEKKSEQENRLVLMDERAVIARELHDSLAQSLSYLKIQMSLLQTQLNRDSDKEQLESTIRDIREGISAAYQQLRELLTTFRLKLDLKGLQSALQGTAVEYSEKMQIPVNLTYNLEHVRFTPNEEMHILQIIRESLSNVARHSGASQANIICKAADINPANKKNEVQFIVTDNGKGLTQPSSAGHYGLTIMQERANSLNAKLTITDNTPSGVTVNLQFSPIHH